jgi:Tfp pilus assembly protein PilN
MESISPNVLTYLLITWGAVTAVFLGLLIWQSILSNQEDDQLFLDSAEDHMAREQREVVARITRLSRPITTTGIASAALLLVMAGVWLYNGLKMNW